MKIGKFLILFLSSIILISIFLFVFDINILAQNSSIFINLGGLFNGGLNIGYSYYFSPNLAIRGSFILGNISGISITMLGIGIEYFLGYYKGFFFGADIGFGSVNVGGIQLSVNYFKGFCGYRFLFDSFFIDTGLNLGILSMSGYSKAGIGITLELGFLF